MRRTQKKYSKEFKEEAVKLAAREGFTKASEELGVHHTSIRKWDQASDSKASSNSKSNAELEAENRRLKKEMGYLKKINEVLKKSTAIFSNDHLGDSK